MGVKRIGMLENERVDRKGKKEKEGMSRVWDSTLQPDVTTLLYSDVLFIQLLVFSFCFLLSSKAICPSTPSIPFFLAVFFFALPGGYF